MTLLDLLVFSFRPDRTHQLAHPMFNFYFNSLITFVALAHVLFLDESAALFLFLVEFAALVLFIVEFAAHALFLIAFSVQFLFRFILAPHILIIWTLIIRVNSFGIDLRKIRSKEVQTYHHF